MSSISQEQIPYGNCRSENTVEDFEAFVAKYPDRLFELIHGEIVQKSTTEWHGILVANIATEGIYLKSNPIGYAGIVVSHQMPNDRYNERFLIFHIGITPTSNFAKKPIFTLIMVLGWSG